MTRSRVFKVVALALAFTFTLIGSGMPSMAAAKAANDPLYPRQWWLRRVGAPEAWKTTTGKGITIAIVDTGVDPRHPDLKARLVPGFDAIRGNAANTDPNGHGTGVAGVAAATRNNKVGIAGVAPDARIMPLRGCSRAGENTCDGQAVYDSIIYAADHGANVINLSLGGNLPVGVPDWDAAIAYATAKGVLVVAAAGNSASAFCSTPAFNPLVLCVGASDETDGIADFSSYGLRLDVVAPGQGVLSTDRFPFLYKSWDGTSFSSPLVAGIGALLMAQGASPLQAGLIIRGSAKDLGLPGYDTSYGFGRVNAKAAVDLCSRIC